MVMVHYLHAQAQAPAHAARGDVVGEQGLNCIVALVASTTITTADNRCLVAVGAVFIIAGSLVTNGKN